MASGPEYLLAGNVFGYDLGTSYDAGGTTITQVLPTEIYEAEINTPVEVTSGTNYYPHTLNQESLLIPMMP